MKEVLFEVIKEAQVGKIIIDGESWPICFNSLIKENNQYHSFMINDRFPLLLIDNLEEFLSLLEEYLCLEKYLNRRHPAFINNQERNLQKILISYLFANATTEEFLDPCAMLRTKIAFLKDKTLTKFNQSIILEDLSNSKLHISNNLEGIQMETPNKIEIAFTNDADTYLLPSISYGISGDTCYIYSILNPKQEISTTYQKKIKRLLYKINDAVPETELHVSPSAVLSLSIFIKILQLHHINKIKVVPYLPLRYLSRELIAKERLEYIERNNRIQTNATDKFINTFLRLKYHNMLEIISYPYESDDYLGLKITSHNVTNNHFLNSINKKITK